MKIITKTGSKKKLILTIKKKMVEILGTHNGERGSREFNTHKDMLKVREAGRKLQVTYLMTLCDWMEKKAKCVIVIDQNLL